LRRPDSRRHENVITSHNAHKIRRKILCEGANGPTTAVADEILAEKKNLVIPDILAKPAASPSLTLNGSRIARASSGMKN